jgi:glycosyltransferase involved in cell wall biosynthesis
VKSNFQRNNKFVKPLIVWQAHEGNLSGANIAMLEYIDALQETYRSHVILPHEGSMRKALTEHAVPISVIPQYGWAGTIPVTAVRRRLKQFVRSRIAVKAVEELLQQAGAALVCTNTLVPFVAAKAAYNLRLPHVWWIHEFGEEDFGFRIGHGDPSSAYKKMQQWSRLVICNSKAVTQKFKSFLPSVDVQCIYQPVTWHITDATAKKALASGYLMFGQLTASKGHLDVLEAVAKAKKLGVEVKLAIKGPCEQPAYLALLQQFVVEHHLQEHVNIEPGFFIREEVLPKYEVLIVASRSEAFGRVIVEANKAGLSVVVKDSGGAPEMVNSNNGVLYTTTDELCAVFAGKIALPVTAPILCYNSEAEIEHLQKILSAIK